MGATRQFKEDALEPHSPPPMMYLLSFLVCLGLVYQVIGLTIVEPGSGAEWTTTGNCAIPRIL